MNTAMSFLSSITSLLRNYNSNTPTPPPAPPSALNDAALRTILNHRAAGNSHFSKDEFDKALSEYSKAIKSFNNGTKNANSAGVVLSDEERGLGSNPAKLLAALLSNRAAALLKLEDYKDALKDAEECAKLRPEWVKGWFRKGEALLALEREVEAKAAFEKAASITPDDKRIADRLFQAGVAVANAEAGIKVLSLSPGHDGFCKGSLNPINKLIGQFATELRNYIHLVADLRSNECVVVDPCWDSEGILRIVAARGWKLVGIIVTHAHFDHVGGKPPKPFDSYGVRVPGLASLLKRSAVNCYMHLADLPQLLEHNPELASHKFHLTSDGSPLDVLPRLNARFLHTPGHTPGSQSLYLPLAQPLLFSGDLVFPSSCGRMDFPESEPDVLFSTLAEKLDELPDSTAVFPGHDYGGEILRLGWERERGCVGQAGVGRLRRELGM